MDGRAESGSCEAVLLLRWAPVAAAGLRHGLWAIVQAMSVTVADRVGSSLQQAVAYRRRACVQEPIGETYCILVRCILLHSL